MDEIQSKDPRSSFASHASHRSDASGVSSSASLISDASVEPQHGSGSLVMPSISELASDTHSDLLASAENTVVSAPSYTEELRALHDETNPFKEASQPNMIADALNPTSGDSVEDPVFQVSNRVILPNETSDAFQFTDKNSSPSSLDRGSNRVGFSSNLASLGSTSETLRANWTDIQGNTHNNSARPGGPSTVSPVVFGLVVILGVLFVGAASVVVYQTMRGQFRSSVVHSPVIDVTLTPSQPEVADIPPLDEPVPSVDMFASLSTRASYDTANSVLIRIDSTPAGAIVYQDGIPMGTTPFRFYREKGSKSQAFTLKLDRYRDATVDIVPSKDITQSISLKSTTTRARPKKTKRKSSVLINPFS